MYLFFPLEKAGMSLLLEIFEKEVHYCWVFPPSWRPSHSTGTLLSRSKFPLRVNWVGRSGSCRGSCGTPGGLEPCPPAWAGLEQAPCTQLPAPAPTAAPGSLEAMPISNTDNAGSRSSDPKSSPPVTAAALRRGPSAAGRANCGCQLVPLPRKQVGNAGGWWRWCHWSTEDEVMVLQPTQQYPAATHSRLL